MNNKECLYWGNCGVKLITESEGATQCNNQSNCSLIDDGFEYKRFSKFIPSGATIEESQYHICRLSHVLLDYFLNFIPIKCCHFQNFDGPALYSLIFPRKSKQLISLLWTCNYLAFFLRKFAVVWYVLNTFFKGQRKPLVLNYIVKSVLV